MMPMLPLILPAVALRARVRKILQCLGALTLALSACGPTPAPTAAPGTTPTTPPMPSPSQAGAPRPTPTHNSPVESTLNVRAADLRGLTVRFWHATTGPEAVLLAQLADEFNTTNEWGIKVQAEAYAGYDALSEQITANLQSDTAPELLLAYPYQAHDWDPTLEKVVDLNPYVNDPLWGLSRSEQEDFPSPVWGQDLYADMRLGLPAQRSGQVLYYNQTWARELGFNAPPSTPAQFRTQACAAAQANLKDKDRQNDHTGGWIITTQPSAVMTWLFAFGAQVTRPDGTGYQFDTGEVRNALTFLRQLYDSGCAWLPESEHTEADFASRRGLFASGSLTNIPYQAAMTAQTGSTDEWTVLPYPTASGSPVVDVYGPSLMVLKSTSEVQLAAWLFARWLTSPDIQARWSRTSYNYPVRSSALDSINTGSGTLSQWQAALQLLPDARAEPAFPSWSTVRWAVGDAATQLFRYYFAADQVPVLSGLLNRTASELHAKSR
jgi:multiple sugar transport system substrate-binding protein